MSDTAWKVVVAVSGILLVVGLYLGTAQIKVAALDGSLDCGSAFQPSDHLFAGAAVAAECDAKVADRRTLAVALMVGGGLAVVVGQIQRGRRNDEESSEPAPSVTP